MGEIRPYIVIIYANDGSGHQYAMRLMAWDAADALTQARLECEKTTTYRDGEARHPQPYQVEPWTEERWKELDAVFGLAQYFGGHLGLAEIMDPSPDKAVLVMGDQEPELETTLFFCTDCYVGGKTDLCRAVEAYARKKAEEDAGAEGDG